MSKIAVIGIIGNSVFLPVEKFHEGGETVEASSVHFEPGGKGFNQAVAAARCGAEVSFMAAVGVEYRKKFADFLDNEKISHTLVFKEESTAFAAIVTDKSGNNHVTVYQGAQLSAEDVLLFEEEIKTADILLINNESLKIDFFASETIQSETPTTPIFIESYISFFSKNTCLLVSKNQLLLLVFNCGQLSQHFSHFLQLTPI